MKTTLDLPDDLIRLTKLRAVAQGRALKDLVAEFIRQGLGGQSAVVPSTPVATNKRVITGPDGLPLIRCTAGAPASRTSVKALLALEQRALADDDQRHAGRPV